MSDQPCKIPAWRLVRLEVVNKHPRTFLGYRKTGLAVNECKPSAKTSKAHCHTAERFLGLYDYIAGRAVKF